MGKPQPAVSSTPVCAPGRRCHVAGKGLTRFGTKFTRDKVLEIASSSVLLIDHPRGQSPQPFGSGTLISQDVVLCAAHSLSLVGSNVEILLFYECGPQGSPPGSRDQYGLDSASVSAWRSCTKLRTKPQGRMLKVLEEGHPDRLDYALLLMEWTDLVPGPATYNVRVPRDPIAKAPSRTLTRELLVVGHPIPPPLTMGNAEPTQASAGILLKQEAPNFMTGWGSHYSYAGFSTASGMSGAGVFNDAGHIVGVFKGIKAGEGASFLNLGSAADALRSDSALRQWVREGSLLRPNDPVPDIQISWP